MTCVAWRVTTADEMRACPSWTTRSTNGSPALTLALKASSERSGMPNSAGGRVMEDAPSHSRPAVLAQYSRLRRTRPSVSIGRRAARVWAPGRHQSRAAASVLGSRAAFPPRAPSVARSGARSLVAGKRDRTAALMANTARRASSGSTSGKYQPAIGGSRGPVSARVRSRSDLGAGASEDDSRATMAPSKRRVSKRWGGFENCEATAEATGPSRREATWNVCPPGTRMVLSKAPGRTPSGRSAKDRKSCPATPGRTGVTVNQVLPA